MVDATLVTVHGFWSSPATWDRLRAVWQADDALDGLDVYGFGYPSPKKPRLPLSWTRIPDLDDIAQMLAAEYTTVLGKAASVAFVTHSQGGLVLQRFLAWMISEGRARELARIRTIVMLACPNAGSQYLASIRHTLGYSRHPQAADLKVLSKQVADTQRAVLARIVHADGVSDHHCRIPVHIYAAGSDAIVPAQSAQAAFPGAGTLAGNHFTILDPVSPGNRTADVIKYHILSDLAEQPHAFGQGPGCGVPATGPLAPSESEVSSSGFLGVRVGDNNVQAKISFVPAVADSVPHAPPEDGARRSPVFLNGPQEPALRSLRDWRSRLSVLLEEIDMRPDDLDTFARDLHETLVMPAYKLMRTEAAKELGAQWETRDRNRFGDTYHAAASKWPAYREALDQSHRHGTPTGDAMARLEGPRNSYIAALSSFYEELSSILDFLYSSSEPGSTQEPESLRAPKPGPSFAEGTLPKLRDWRSRLSVLLEEIDMRPDDLDTFASDLHETLVMPAYKLMRTEAAKELGAQWETRDRNRFGDTYHAAASKWPAYREALDQSHHHGTPTGEVMARLEGPRNSYIAALSSFYEEYSSTLDFFYPP